MFEVSVVKYFDPIMDDAFKRNDFDLSPIPGYGTYLDRAWLHRHEYSFDIVKLLIEYGESLNYPGYPSIVMAARRGKYDEIQFVLDRGADINAVTHTGVSASRFVEQSDLEGV